MADESGQPLPPHLSPPAPVIEWDSGGVLPGFSLNPAQREWLHKRINRDLPPEVYRDHMTGHRILVVPRPAADKYGSLWLPASARERAQSEMGAGWVVAVGPLVGALGATHPVGILCAHPSALLCRHVIYEMHSGTNLRVSEDDTEFGGASALIILTDRDILQVGALDPEVPR